MRASAVRERDDTALPGELLDRLRGEGRLGRLHEEKRIAARHAARKAVRA